MGGGTTYAEGLVRWLGVVRVRDGLGVPGGGGVACRRFGGVVPALRAEAEGAAEAEGGVSGL